MRVNIEYLPGHVHFPDRTCMDEGISLAMHRYHKDKINQFHLKMYK